MSTPFCKGASDGAARQLSSSFCGQFQGARQSDVAAGAFPQALLEEPALPSVSRLEQAPFVDTQLQRATGIVGSCSPSAAAIRDSVAVLHRSLAPRAASSRDKAPSDTRGAASDSQALSSFDHSGGGPHSNVLQHQEHHHTPPQPLVQLVWGPSSGTYGDGARALALATSALPRKQRAGEAPCDGEHPTPADAPVSKRARHGSSTEAAGHAGGGMGTSVPPACGLALSSTPALLSTVARPSVCAGAPPGLSLALEGPVQGAWRSTGYGTQGNATAAAALCASAPVCRDQNQQALAQCTRQTQQQGIATQLAGGVPVLAQVAMHVLQGPGGGGSVGMGAQASCGTQSSGLPRPRQGGVCGTGTGHPRLTAEYDSVGLSSRGAEGSSPITQLHLPKQLQLPSVPSLPTWLTHPLLLQPSYFTNPWVVRGLEQQAMAAQLQQQQRQQQKQQEGGQRLAQLLKPEAWQQQVQQQHPK